MAEASFLTVPGSDEPTRPFAEVVDGARRALPPAFPHEADKVMVALLQTLPLKRGFLII